MRFILDAHRVLFSLNFREINWRSPKTIAILVAVALLLASGIYFIASGDEETPEEVVRTREVTLASVGNLSADTAPLPVVGTVTSATEATISAESGGRVTGVYAKLGDFVSAGRIIAETENSAQRAAVLQAEGSLDSAQANLKKVQSGARSEELAISQTGAQSAETALAQSRIATANAIKATYNTNDDLIHAKLDVLFSNPRSSAPQFNPNTSDGTLVNSIKNTRVQIETLLTAQAARGATITENSDLKAELARAQTETQTIRSFIDSISQALNKAIASETVPQSAIDGYVSLTSASRSTVSASLSALSGAAQELNGREAALATSEKQLEQTQSGARPEDVAAAQATVKQSQGSYNAALSALEKTRIRAPISGTLNTFSLSVGDSISPSQKVAVIANNNALEVLTYITDEDRSSVVVGNKATIEGRHAGVVTKVASAIDSATRKIEVRIALTGDTNGLTNGQSVRAEISRAVRAEENIERADEPLAIPLSAVKIEADRTIIFTLDPENKLIAHSVELGPLLGDKIQVRSGLTADMQIVTDARGLKEGQQVTIKQ